MMVEIDNEDINKIVKDSISDLNKIKEMIISLRDRGDNLSARAAIMLGAFVLVTQATIESDEKQTKTIASRDKEIKALNMLIDNQEKSQKPMVNITNAAIVNNNGVHQLSGIVTSHPHIPNGRYALTSRIVKTTIETLNTTYNVQLQ